MSKNKKVHKTQIKLYGFRHYHWYNYKMFAALIMV
jgi:hypothetical protein